MLGDNIDGRGLGEGIKSIRLQYCCLDYNWSLFIYTYVFDYMHDQLQIQIHLQRILLKATTAYAMNSQYADSYS